MDVLSHLSEQWLVVVLVVIAVVSYGGLMLAIGRFAATNRTTERDR